MGTKQQIDVDISAALVEAIREFPTSRSVTHCGTTFTTSPLALYFRCPECNSHIKLRAFSGGPELEDVFDAVLAWMTQPQAEEYAQQRLQTIATDSVEVTAS